VQVGIPMLDGVVEDPQEVRSRIAVLQAMEAELFARAVTVIQVREDERYRTAGHALGLPHTVDTYRPSKKQKRLLRARDVRCRFPGCRRPARGSDRNADLDHSLAWVDGGTTAIDNLAHLCRRHHTLKHETDWTVEQLPGGILRWTTPTLRTHDDRPPGTVVFIPTDDDSDDPPPPF
jgi:hypothetical protein